MTDWFTSRGVYICKYIYIYIYISKKSRNTNSTISFETAMLKSNLCDYGDANILVKWSVIIIGNMQVQPQIMQSNSNI